MMDDLRPKASRLSGCSRCATVLTSLVVSSTMCAMSSNALASSGHNLDFQFFDFHLDCNERLADTVVQFTANSSAFVVLWFENRSGKRGSGRTAVISSLALASFCAGLTKFPIFTVYEGQQTER